MMKRQYLLLFVAALLAALPRGAEAQEKATADNLVALNQCIENDDFVAAHALCHKMLPMFIQLQQGQAITFLSRMNESKGLSGDAYPEWKEDAVKFMDMADQLLEMLSEKYEIV